MRNRFQVWDCLLGEFSSSSAFAGILHFARDIGELQNANVYAPRAAEKFPGNPVEFPKSWFYIAVALSLLRAK
jgi:hypothetical protein